MTHYLALYYEVGKRTLLPEWTYEFEAANRKDAVKAAMSRTPKGLKLEAIIEDDAKTGFMTRFPVRDGKILTYHS